MKKLNEYITEAAEYELMFMQYDPDVQEEYENGDATDEELHDSMFESDKVKSVKFSAPSDKIAVKKATDIISKECNKHPELCGGCLYCEGDIVETILL